MFQWGEYPGEPELRDVKAPSIIQIRPTTPAGIQTERLPSSIGSSLGRNTREPGRPQKTLLTWESPGVFNAIAIQSHCKRILLY